MHLRWSGIACSFCILAGFAIGLFGYSNGVGHPLIWERRGAIVLLGQVRVYIFGMSGVVGSINGVVRNKIV